MGPFVMFMCDGWGVFKRGLVGWLFGLCRVDYLQCRRGMAGCRSVNTEGLLQNYASHVTCHRLLNQRHSILSSFSPLSRIEVLGPECGVCNDLLF